MGFRFKKFELDDSHCAQKIGTDGVLLGAWTALSPDDRTILDIGAGCGLVSMMLAQRTEFFHNPVQITAVEIDPAAADDCRNNGLNSPWADRFNVVNCDFELIQDKFDVIVSNPPFFNGDLPANGEARMLARQGLTLNYFSLISFAASHLTSRGRLVFTSDTRHESRIIYCSEIEGLTLNRLCRVSGKPGREPRRLLWEFGKLRDNGPLIQECICHRNADGSYHPDYIAMTHPFYLNMAPGQ